MADTLLDRYIQWYRANHLPRQADLVSNTREMYLIPGRPNREMTHVALFAGPNATMIPKGTPFIFLKEFDESNFLLQLGNEHVLLNDRSITYIRVVSRADLARG